MKEILGRYWQFGLRMLSENKASHIFAVGESNRFWFAEILASPHWVRRRWMSLFGWPGMAGIGLMVACLVFFMAFIRPAEFRLDSARQSAIQLHKQGKHDANEASRELQPTEQLAEFYRAFPNDSDLLPGIEKIFTLAQNQNLTLDQGEYKLSRDKVGKLVRFQMVLPVKGDYPQIRKYLDSLLTEIPNIALEHLQLERRKVGDPALEATIRLALYLEQES